jgi:signal transduction histidine kinase/ligand-binding sensor domain-containing protein
VPNSVISLLRAALLAGLISASAAVANAATNSPWLARTWQSDDGLPGNIVTGVSQTPNGYLWVATQNGLVQFDGVRFRQITLPKVPGRRSSILRTLLRGREGNLWLGTDGAALVRLDQSGTNSHTVAEGLPYSQPVDMAQDRNGAIWMAFLNRTVCRITGDRVEVFGPAEGLPGGNGPCAVASDAEAQLWFAQGGRVGVFRGDRFQVLATLEDSSMRIAGARAGGVWVCAGLRLFRYEEGAGPVELGKLSPERAGAAPTAILEDRSGAVWIGTSTSGLFRYEGKHFEKVQTSHLEIESLTEDREGNLWVGTGGGGLDRLRPRVLELQGTESGLPFESVISVCEDAVGGFWATTQDGVLARWQGTTWAAILKADGWPGGSATCLAADRQGGLWVGTRNRGIYRWQNGKFSRLDRRDGLAGDNIRALLATPSGDLWIGLDSQPALQRLRDGVLRTYALPSTNRAIRAMAEDAAGDIWMGTTDGLLLRLKGDQILNETQDTQSPPPPIRCLYATPDGTVWIGYAGAGIGRWKAGHYARVGMTQGLLDGHISQMVVDDRGSIWLAGNRGIFQVWRQELDEVMDGHATHVRSIIYGRDEGLSSLQANYGYAPGALRSRDGRIWFLMRTGLAVVRAKNVRDNLLPPQVMIEEMVVDGRPVNPQAEDGETHPAVPPSKDTTLRLPPGHRRLDFEFTALSFMAPENVHFRYRLEGVDDDWVEAGTRRNASYPRLAAGRYRFQVLACNNTGIWNETGATLGFAVLPFFWQTWWFRLAVLAGSTLALMAIVRYVFFRRLRLQLRVLEQQAALHKERARIAKDMHDDLGASLTQIALLSELARQDISAPQKAAEHIQKISGTARQVVKSLDEIVWAVNPRNDTLAHLIDYVGQFTLDFLRAPGIRCRFDLPENPPARNIPADVRHNLFLVIKEALHNIVKHAHPSEVWLRASVSNQGLQIIIEDNGCGFERPPEDAWADGLRNMRQRMAEIGGEFRIESQVGAGTKIRLQLPWPRS